MDTDIRQEEFKQKVGTYDFRRPHKFSKEHLRFFQRLHETFARHYAVTLSASLRARVHLNVVAMDQMTFEEFIRSVPAMTLMAIVEADPLAGNFILEINPSIVYPMMDRLLGGYGAVFETLRELTDIEEALYRDLARHALACLAEAYQDLIQFQLQIVQVETNPQFVQIVPPHTPVIMVTFEVSLQDHTGLMSLCLPDVFLGPLLRKISVQQWFGRPRGTPPEDIEALQYHLRQARIPVQVEIGTAKIALRDLLDLQVGDVLCLDRRVNEEVQVIVGQQGKFWGRPGMHNQNLAVQITRVLDEPWPSELLKTFLPKPASSPSAPLLKSEPAEPQLSPS